MFMTMIRIIVVKILVRWCNKQNFLMCNMNDHSNVYLYYTNINQIKKAHETYKANKCKMKTLINEYKLSVIERMNN